MTSIIDLGKAEYVVSLHKQVGSSHYRIYLMATMVDEDIQNKTIKVQIPNVSSPNSTSPVTKYKDLKRIEHVFSIQGKIYYQKALIAGSAATDDPNTWLTASQAKNALIAYILYSSGSINLYWRSIMDTDANPSSDYTDLMNSNQELRTATTILDKVKFSDPAISRYKTYTLSGVPAYTWHETSPEYFNINLTLTRGQQF